MTDAIPKIVAVLDTCVLYPPFLRNLLIWLGTIRAYESRRTEDNRAEWIRNVLADHLGMTPAHLDSTRRLIRQADPDRSGVRL